MRFAVAFCRFQERRWRLPVSSSRRINCSPGRGIIIPTSRRFSSRTRPLVIASPSPQRVYLLVYSCKLTIVYYHGRAFTLDVVSNFISACRLFPLFSGDRLFPLFSGGRLFPLFSGCCLFPLFSGGRLFPLFSGCCLFTFFRVAVYFTNHGFLKVYVK